MQITRRSILSGTTRTLDLPVTQGQLDRWTAGEYVQVAMPHLSADEREFIMTGVTAEEWDATFGEGE
jgi:hypothetical protein